MKIIIDAFGGDNAPSEVIRAARQAKDELGVDMILTGDAEKLQNCATSIGVSIADMEVLHAPAVFDIHAVPTTIVKEGRDTSLAVGLQALRDGKGDAFVSAGSSGGLVTGATLLTRRIKGIKRPAMTAMLPTAKDKFILLDAGANIECRPEMLVQFAIMGSAYMERVLGIKNPKVGLLNIGAEETKGRELELEAYKLLEQSGLNFGGNIEARDIPNGQYQVIVTDGFTGNIVLKLYEGMGSFFARKLRWIFSGAGKLGAVFSLGKIRAFKKQMDYKEVGGSALLGVRKPVIKAHGSSDGTAFFNAVRQAKKCAEVNVAGVIEEYAAATHKE